MNPAMTFCNEEQPHSTRYLGKIIVMGNICTSSIINFSIPDGKLRHQYRYDNIDEELSGPCIFYDDSQVPQTLVNILIASMSESIRMNRPRLLPYSRDSIVPLFIALPSQMRSDALAVPTHNDTIRQRNLTLTSIIGSVDYGTIVLCQIRCRFARVTCLHGAELHARNARWTGAFRFEGRIIVNNL